MAEITISDMGVFIALFLGAYFYVTNQLTKETAFFLILFFFVFTFLDVVSDG